MVTKTAIGTLDRRRIAWFGTALLLAAALFQIGTARAQEYTEAELEELVAPVALYPDDVLGIVLPASTFPLDVVRAARFLEDRENAPELEPDPAWDDSVVALLNYPEVVHMLDEDIDWTWDLGEAVLTDQAAVLAAAQRFRARAYAAGNLPSDDRQTVTQSEGNIEIKPADPTVVYIPVYEPREVVVYHPAPIWRYYPVGYPVYYYPYPAGYYFGVDYFWGVTSYFSIGWHSHYLHVHHYTNHLHPYYLNNYYSYVSYYPRNRVNVTVVVNNEPNVWTPGPRRYDRPRTITVEGRASGPRTQRTASTESQPNVTTRTSGPSARASSQSTRTQGSGAERQATTETARMQSARPDAATNARQRSETGRPVQSPGVTGSQTRRVETRESTPSTSSSARQQSTRPTTAQPSTRTVTTPQGSSRAPVQAPRAQQAPSTGSSTAPRVQQAPSTRSSAAPRTQQAPSTGSSAAPRMQAAPSTRSSSSGSVSTGATRQSGAVSSPRAQGTTRAGMGASSSSSSGARTRQR